MDEASSHRYVVALGSNMRVPGAGRPRRVVARALEILSDLGIDVLATASVMETKPVGPSMRRYANSAALLETSLAPPALLDVLQRVEADFGRRRRGQRWRARPLDLDIILWSAGTWNSPELKIPHPLFRERDFVLAPAAEIAPNWRDPVSGLTLRQLSARAA